MTVPQATPRSEQGSERAWTAPDPPREDGSGGDWTQTYELKGTWTFVSWGAMVTIALVPFTNLFLPGTDRQYSVMSVTQLFFWACLLLSPRVLKRGLSSILIWMMVLFGIRYVYGSLLSNLPEQMADSTRNMIRPMLWAWVLTAAMRVDQIRKRGCDFFVLGCTVAGVLHLLGVGTEQSIGEVLNAQRISAFELNANVLGVIYATGFLIALARVIQARAGYGRFTRLLFAGAGVIALLGLLLTGSRTAGVFVAVGSLVLVMVETRRAGWSQPAILTTVLLVGGLLGVGLVNSIIGQRSERIVDSGVSSEARARMAPILIEQFLRAPLLGLGPENYRAELGHRSRSDNSDFGIVAHNQLAMFAVEMGLFGIVPFLSLCGLLIYQSWRVRMLEGGLPLALALPCVITACTTSNIAFHWHFHFIVGLVAGAFWAQRMRQDSLEGTASMNGEP
ncbi:O-antigen ligase family protein [Geothrix campi]|uniref:O-antigen ligase family protein n=1 Tax=Geothrix campi TaxID=2966450 RepID=UPI002148D9D3|nr:O-antigen ligase family protein [Geothrix sp. SG10]